MNSLIRAGTNLNRNRLFWIFQSIGWLGVVFIAVAIAGPAYMDPDQAVVLALARIVFGIGLTCGMRLIYRRIRSADLSFTVVIPFALLLSLGAAYLDVVATRGIGIQMGLDLESELLTAFLRSGLFLRWFLYSFWSALYFGINYVLDAQKFELELTRAEALASASELKALKAQVNPHFLFNVLGSIIAEAGDNPKLRTMILALSDYLRYSLQIHQDKEPLGHELDALESYLQVEKARFEEKLEYEICADETTRALLAPIALVQPLLENAIKYGQHTSPAPLLITVQAKIIKKHLQLKVSNTGTWVSPENSRSTKTGLANLRRRLEILYGNAAKLEIDTDTNHVEVTATIPVEREKERHRDNPESTDR